ncbi:MAG: hypothetical protein HS115_18995 [Spirochaetales bacterium]|nr:hypothetical protein [Spirochaetales bacterium]
MKAVKRRYLLLLFLFLSCPENDDDAIMLHVYRLHHEAIARAVIGTDLTVPYLAALISLESHPPGNSDSARFEAKIYERLLRAQAGEPYGQITARELSGHSDGELRELATSYGLTQIMGFHCLRLGCSIIDLKGPYHLEWASAWMQRMYGKHARKKDWTSCFRIHNTGRPNGKTHRADYVEKGLLRMAYYEKWMKHGGDPLKRWSRQLTGP